MNIYCWCRLVSLYCDIQVSIDGHHTDTGVGLETSFFYRSLYIAQLALVFISLDSFLPVIQLFPALTHSNYVRQHLSVRFCLSILSEDETMMRWWRAVSLSEYTVSYRQSASPFHSSVTYKCGGVHLRLWVLSLNQAHPFNNLQNRTELYWRDL